MNRWLAVDRGVAFDPALTEVPAKALHDAERVIASLANHSSKSSGPARLSVADCPPPTNLRKASNENAIHPNDGDCGGGGGDGGDGSGAIMDTAGMPDGTLTLGSDGFYYDSYGYEWEYYDSTGQWLKTIAAVTAMPAPSVYQPYITAYNYINGMEPLWWAFALPIPDDMVPWQSLVERFGLRGALAMADRLLGQVLEKLVAKLGSDNVLRMTANEANSIMVSHGATKAPFMAGLDAAQFTVDSAMQSGQIAGSQLVRVGTDQTISNGSGWMTTMDQITNSDGSMMTGQEIADRLGLQTAPTQYGIVSGISSGSEFLVGVANDMASYGWGSGGGIQYFQLSGTYKFSSIGSIP